MTVKIILPDALAESLDDLKEQTKADSLDEVVKDALQFYAAAVHHHHAGRKIYVRGDIGKEEPFFVENYSYGNLED